MDDFDTILELKLRHLLDPVVASRPPARRGRLDTRPSPVLTVQAGRIDLAAETIPVAVEPVAVTAPVATSP